ncbi:hypothetical protein [Aquisalinus flavus]|uniref:Uncharacterized protein n=1 Tax=Aquisalinus flavus TaxID=1526572 RepID=A0A8J2V385_9PROT|nr:hypothetical protein [Aquisalinus flavus]MBD0426214.1 hypothetical protein [Aquisalinus flavus]UNE48214.1 hypothetical protein FF099_09195 [Aquisalinus flavus]GGD09705.1 hypothetical protein GCM10011342_18240 [Aquisalinus flavus]
MNKKLLTFALAGLVAACGQPEPEVEEVVIASFEADLADYFADWSQAPSINVDETGLTLQGDYQREASHQVTSGIVYRLPDEVEYAASENIAHVSITARGGPYAVNYFTMEVGHAGWQMYETSEDFAEQEFSFEVPAMVDGLSDVISIVPLSSEPVQVSDLSVRVTMKDGGAQPAE